ncbi:MAG: acetamidase/formamidase family protein [Solirubrobacteraceae bacterium]
MRELRQEGPYHYVFSPYAEPIASVVPGETVAVHTEDAFEGRITTEEDLPSRVLGPNLNPQTGPIYVEGAEPGDTLAVRIESIEPARDWAVSAFVPYFGGLTATQATRLLHDPLPERLYFYQLQDGVFRHRDRIAVPLRPFLGTIGTAPQLEAISALTPHNHGGNMDVRDTCPGNTVYLPVRTPGALFYTGDAHGNQGDGELCGVALEISARAELTLDVIKGEAIQWPRIESPTKLMTVGSARPMEDAARIAYTELVEWIASDHGFERLDAYQLLTQLGELYVGNMVDTNYSLVAAIAKEHLRPSSE